MNLIAEIVLADHCRPVGVSLIAWMMARQRVGVITTEHAASSYGIPVVMVDGRPVDYKDIRSIGLMMPGTMADYRAAMDAQKNPMEGNDWPIGLTEADVADVRRRLAPFDVTVAAY